MEDGRSEGKCCTLHKEGVNWRQLDVDVCVRQFCVRRLELMSDFRFSFVTIQLIYGLCIHKIVRVWKFGLVCKKSIKQLLVQLQTSPPSKKKSKNLHSLNEHLTATDPEVKREVRIFCVKRTESENKKKTSRNSEPFVETLHQWPRRLRGENCANDVRGLVEQGEFTGVR